MKALFTFLISLQLVACASSEYKKTAEHVDIQRFMGDWYVLAGRFTSFEKEVYNSLEKYSWNEKQNRIDIDFSYRYGDFSGERKSLPQKAWIKDTTTNARWSVQPLWPLHFNYLIVAIADDYSWTAIGVPNQKYLWIMARDWQNPVPKVLHALNALTAAGYDVHNLVEVPQKWP
jgi:apolipoprotein D and lipocalin family protein